MSEILLSGVSTRRYAGVLPKMAKTVGVSRSQLSRKLIAAGAKLLQGLMSRSLEGLPILVVYIDGVVIAGQSVVVAIGVDTQGAKHLLGLTLGATENATVVKDLLADLLKRGLDAGAKAAVRHRRIQGVASGHRAQLRRGRLWCSAAGCTSCATCSTTCPRRSRPRSRPASMPPSSSHPRKASRD